MATAKKIYMYEIWKDRCPAGLMSTMGQDGWTLVDVYEQAPGKWRHTFVKDS